MFLLLLFQLFFCPSPNDRRLPFYTRSITASVRLPDGLSDTRRLSRESYAAMPLLEAATLSIVQRLHSGTRSGAPDAQRLPGSSPMNPSGSMFKPASRGLSKTTPPNPLSLNH